MEPGRKMMIGADLAAGFDGADGQEYERVSETLFTIMNEAIEIAASSSVPA